MFTRKRAVFLAVLILMLSSPGAVTAQSFSLEKEIALLPEMKSSPSPKIADTLLALSKQYPEAFQKMFQIGLPTHRKYCSPLQAVYWLYEDNYGTVAEKLIANYDLNKLLGAAWYSNKYVSSHPELLAKQKQRWDDFDTVVERLNAPELINFYERKFFKYNWDNSKNELRPEYIFNRKDGNCSSYSAFTLHCLAKAGYEAWIINPPKHWTTLFKMNDKFYVIDNSRGINGKLIGYQGPFDTVNDIVVKFRYY
jgi:hypothetical protein